jgi:preprotein translocase subunit YajC
VTVTRGPTSLPETIVTGGGVIVAVFEIVAATVAIEVTKTVFVTLFKQNQHFIGQ